MKMKIYCFGNEFIKEDSLAKEIADELQIEGIEFIKCLSPEELPLDEPNLIILDVAKGIKDTKIIENLDNLKTDRACMSCHDMDLAFNLKLLKATGSLKQIKIIAIPIDGDKEQVIKELKTLLQH